MCKPMYIIDSLMFTCGALILAAVFIGDGVAASVGLTAAVTGRDAELPFIMAALLTLSWPLARRVMGVLCDPSRAVEYSVLAREARRCGLMHRVQAVNIYLADVPDRHWTNVFATDRDLWEWLGEAFQDRRLRALMHPDVAARAEKAGRAVGMLS